MILGPAAEGYVVAAAAAAVINIVVASSPAVDAGPRTLLLRQLRLLFFIMLLLLVLLLLDHALCFCDSCSCCWITLPASANPTVASVESRFLLFRGRTCCLSDASLLGQFPLSATVSLWICFTLFLFLD